MTNRLLSKLKQLFQAKPTKPREDLPQYLEDSSEVTKELVKITTPIETEDVGYSSPHIEVGYGLSVGKQRTHNEDAFFTLTTMFSFNESEIPFGLYIVADGMGGHKNGEIASELAIRSIVSYILSEIYSPLMGLNPQPGELSIREVFHSGIEKANEEILKNSYGGGTTVTAVLILGEQMTIAHVGDSRVYSIDKDGNVEPMTRDHSLVKRLQELGQITPEEAAVHPQRNVLYRALGQGEPFEPEIISTARPETGALLICSDGLWSIVGQEAISKIINNGSSPQETCDKLIDAANDAGGPDNISAIYVDISPEDFIVIMSDKTDFYRRLNIGTGASEDAIKKAYRLAVKKTHPDVNRNEGATRLFLDIQEAYKVLSDPNKKDAYDDGREPDDTKSSILTNIHYSQDRLTKLEEAQVIYALIDIVSTQAEKDTSNLPLNISLVLDNSTSMDGARIDMLKASTKEIIQELGDDDLISVISFNDRAKVLLPSQPRPTISQVDSSIGGLFAEGGTEIFQGLEAAYEEIRKNSFFDYVNHIVLITDGHTYGDEDNCISLAKMASTTDIGISGLGIGIEWNDEFVDNLCALTGGQSMYVQDINNVKEFLNHSIASLKQAFSRHLSLTVEPAPGVRLLSAFRILPETIPLPLQETFSLGILKKDKPHRILLEFLVDPISAGIDQAVIASGEFILKRKPHNYTIPFTLDRVVLAESEDMKAPEAEIFQAISHLTFYRLQEKAQHDVASGNPGTAFQRLINLSSHLMSKGEEALAKIAMNEADYIKTHSSFSPTGKKDLKYGTMRLMLPDKT